MSKEIEQDILQNYQIVTFMGSGAYGHVWKVIEKASGALLALKKIFDAFQNEVDSQRTYRQVSILYQLDHENIVKLKGVIKSKNNKDLYMLFEFMEADLHSVLNQGILTPPHMKYIAYQICRALKYIHSAQLVHRDLKPSNILVNSNCQIKICDFGLTRTLIRQQESFLILSEDVATRWYRSPQMLLGSPIYNTATDMWSLGCIIAQILNGQPIFSGASTTEQLTKILQFTGRPKKETYEDIGIPIVQSLISQIIVKKRSKQSYFPQSCDEQLKDLALKLLKFNPQDRLKPQQLLDLPLFGEYRSKSSEKICERFIAPDLDDNVRLQINDYKKAIFKDIQRRYPSLNSQPPQRGYRSFNSYDKQPCFQQMRRFITKSLLKPKEMEREIIQKENRFTCASPQQKQSKSLHKLYEKKQYAATNSLHQKKSKKLKLHRKFALVDRQNNDDYPFEQKNHNKFLKRRIKGNFWLNKAQGE